MKKKIILGLISFVGCTMLGLSEEQRMKLHEYYNNKPVLVTGGCGFIGSHLVEQLVELGARVTIIDDLSTGSVENIKKVKNKVTFIHKSIVDMDACLEITRNQSIIFHLAAFISVPQSVKDPVLCHQVNVDGTFNLLEAARHNHVQRFVFSSSCAVYKPSEEILSEQSACDPLSPYGTSKLLGEYYCKQYTTNFNVPTVILRYFNVYGPRQNPNGHYAAAMAKFTHQMHNNLPITIFGDGTQTRDFVPVNTVVEANLILGMREAENVAGEIFNIGTGKSLSLLELIEHLKQQFPHYSGKTYFEKPRLGDIKHVSAHCSKYEHIRTNM